MKLFLRAVAGILLLSAAMAGAAREEVVTTAVGYGQTDQEALGDALARAASQVNGGSASISTRTLNVESDSHVSTNVGVEGDVSSSHKVQVTSDFTAKGQVSRYEVLSTAKLDNKRYEVKVKAWVIKYEAPTKTGKLDRIAVLPVNAPSGSLGFYKESMSYVGLADELGRSLERTLMATGHFQVLDRATLGTSVNELALMNSDLTGPEEKARLRNVRGADFLLSSNLFVSEPGKRNPATGQIMPPKMELDVRFLVPATSEVAYSSRAKVESKGYANKEEAIAAATGKLIREFDLKLKGKSTLADTPSTLEPQGPRDDSGVKLPFD